MTELTATLTRAEFINQRCETFEVLDVSVVRNFDAKMLFDRKDQFDKRQGIETEFRQGGRRIEDSRFDAVHFMDQLNNFVERSHKAPPEESAPAVALKLICMNDSFINRYLYKFPDPAITAITASPPTPRRPEVAL